MKKILLIIAIAFSIFQIVVLAIAIDIGMPAIDRNLASSTGTRVLKDNPANASGRITSVEIYAAAADMIDCEVATFFVVAGDTLSTRDTEYIGTVTYGSKQTFPVNLTVEAGDYIGVYFSAGDQEKDTSGTSWFKSGDWIPASSVTFSSSSYTVSLYGTGTTEEEEEVNAIFFGTNF